MIRKIKPKTMVRNIYPNLWYAKNNRYNNNNKKIAKVNFILDDNPSLLILSRKRKLMPMADNIAIENPYKKKILVGDLNRFPPGR